MIVAFVGVLLTRTESLMTEGGGSGVPVQAPALQAWGGSADNVEAGQSFLALRARCNSAAVAGRYSADMEELARSS